MPIFVPFPDDPDPELPQAHLQAIIAAARRPYTSPTTRKRARAFAQPYANRARELLDELNPPAVLPRGDNRQLHLR